MIYLDNAATSFPKPEAVYKTMLSVMKEKGANPGRGAYRMAIEAAKEVFEARRKLADFIKAEKSEEIVFTANATEAINLVIKGLLVPGDHVVTTSMEHNSVYRPLKVLEAEGVSLTVVNANEEGLVDPRDIENSLRENTKLIIVSHASNVCGSITPIEVIGRIAKKHEIFFAVDAAQSIGYLPVDVQSSFVDFLAFPGHKGLYGPFGTGGLYIRAGATLTPLKHGGTGIHSVSDEMPSVCPERYESGTLNVPGIAGLAAGIDYLQEIGISTIAAKGDRLNRMLLDELQSIQGIKIFGSLTQQRVPVVSFNFANIDSAEAAVIFDRHYDIAVRAGLHCAPLAHKTIGTLNTGTIRVSLGSFNTEEDIAKFSEAAKKISKI